MKNAKILAAASMLLLALACSSGSLGDLGSILGSPSSTTSSDVKGVVNSIDTTNHLVVLDVNYVNNLRTTQSGQTIYYDNSTVVEYQNNQYQVQDLERGDEVSITGSNQNGRYVASRITVTRNVRQ